MVREYEIPSIRGDIQSEELSRLRIFDDKSKPPFELGSLSRDSFDYLGEWMRFQLEGSDHGFFYRMGYKENIIDDEGDPTTAVFHFTTPFGPKGQKVPKEIIKRMESNIEETVLKFTVISKQMSGESITSVRVSLPEWMYNELR